MTTIPVKKHEDPAAAVGRALAALRRAKEIDGQPEESKRRRYFLSTREQKLAKRAAQTRVGGKPQRKRAW